MIATTYAQDLKSEDCYDKSCCGYREAYDQHEVGTFDVKEPAADKTGEDPAKGYRAVDISLPLDLVEPCHSLIDEICGDGDEYRICEHLHRLADIYDDHVCCNEHQESLYKKCGSSEKKQIPLQDVLDDREL